MSEKLTEEQIRNVVRRVIRTCAQATVIECRFWECQKRNECRLLALTKAGRAALGDTHGQA